MRVDACVAACERIEAVAGEAPRRLTPEAMRRVAENYRRLAAKAGRPPLGFGDDPELIKATG